MDVNIQRRINRTIATVMREHGQSYVSARNYAYLAVTGSTFAEMQGRRLVPRPISDPRSKMDFQQRVDFERAAAAQRVTLWARARARARRSIAARV